MKYLFAALVALILTACGEFPVQDRGPHTDMDFTNAPDPVPRWEPPSKYGNKPYQVFGVNYRVIENATGYVERGLASWYGLKFHGQYTSSREVYDMYAMTAAHRTLPLPTYVRVTNVANGRSCVVRVNDRGPFVGDRIIDLSYAAASKLGILQTGTALVEVRALDPNDAPNAPQNGTVVTARPDFRAELSTGLQPVEPITPMPLVTNTTGSTPVAPGMQIYAQAGAFASRENAESLRDRITNEKLPADIHDTVSASGLNLFVVRVGPYATNAEAGRVLARLQELGIRAPRLIQVPR